MVPSFPGPSFPQRLRSMTPGILKEAYVKNHGFFSVVFLKSQKGIQALVSCQIFF
jgi:hypothetical protein